MSDLLHDVDEMMRAERLRTLWNDYGNYAIGAVLALVLGVAANQGYQAWQLSQAERTGNALYTALQSADPAAALENMGAKSHGNAGAMAQILLAQKWIEQKKSAQAASLLLAVRNNAGLHRDLRSLGTLLWARAVSADPAVKFDDIKNALTPLMTDEGLPFAWAARLDLAAATAAQHDYKGAIDLLAPMLHNMALPEPQAERARSLNDLYTYKYQSSLKGKE